MRAFDAAVARNLQERGLSGTARFEFDEPFEEPDSPSSVAGEQKPYRLLVREAPVVGYILRGVCIEVDSSGIPTGKLLMADGSLSGEYVQKVVRNPQDNKCHYFADADTPSAYKNELDGLLAQGDSQASDVKVEDPDFYSAQGSKLILFNSRKVVQDFASEPTLSTKDTLCSECAKPLSPWIAKFRYQGLHKGDLEVTGGRMVHAECLPWLNEPEPEQLAKAAFSAMTGKFTEALSLLETHFDSRSPADWYSKANMLTNLGRDTEALECFDQAIFLDTHHVKAWYRKGWCLFRAQKYDEAYKCFWNVIAIESRSETADIYEMESMKWSKAALLSGIYCLRAKADPKELNVFERDLQMFYFEISTIGELQGKLPSLTRGNLNNGAVADFLSRNASQLMGVLEPNVVGAISVSGERH